MTKVLIGLYHIPHVNFFKNAIKKLEEEGVECLIYLRERGRLLDIAKKELKRDDFTIIGKHRVSTIGKAIGMFQVGFRLFRLIYRNKEIKVVLAIGANELCRASRMLGRKNISFNDDPDTHVFNYTLKIADKLIIPKLIETKGQNISHYNGYKELAYLHPDYFSPNIEILDNFGLEKDNYIFIREQSPVSMVYRHTNIGDFRGIVDELFKRKFNLVFSLEDKENIDFYKGKGLILEEPLEDIHSIISFAQLTLTTGDTLSRESCILGTPSIYAGKREMPINEELISLGIMIKIDSYDKIIMAIDNIVDTKMKARYAPKIKDLITNHWINTTELIVSQIKDSIKSAET